MHRDFVYTLTRLTQSSPHSPVATRPCTICLPNLPSTPYSRLALHQSATVLLHPCSLELPSTPHLTSFSSAAQAIGDGYQCICCPLARQDLPSTPCSRLALHQSATALLHPCLPELPSTPLLTSFSSAAQAVGDGDQAMKRSFSSLHASPKPYRGPKAARESHVELQRLSSVPGHISTRPDLQILPGNRHFSKIPWLESMVNALPMASTNQLREWKLTTVLMLAKNYHKVVHVWDSLTTLVELWHPQTHTFIFPAFEATILLEELEHKLGLPKDKKGEEYDISYTVAPIDS
ncbi:hypothetical protein Taro_033445 [Colocasia esculenta]|uniref:Aminotransferase-like plant mobile domain-containing protein n=1 Tax=Colocasia esculenta TaxID=4460 RepID=A0A843VXX5_COLES|nr:hypothetical protein [Colocasia esculenta]